MKRRMFSILTSSALLLQGMSFPVFADENESKFEPMVEVESLTEEDLVQETSEILHEGGLGTAQWTIDNNGLLTIEAGTYDSSENFSSIPGWDWPWKKYSDEIKAIDGTAPFKAIGSYIGAFLGLTNLTTADFSGWDTSEVMSMWYMFQGCNSLTSITFSKKWDVSKVTEFRSMFGKCSSLTDLDISNWTPLEAVNMEGMFADCKKLTSLNISN